MITRKVLPQQLPPNDSFILFQVNSLFKVSLWRPRVTLQIQGLPICSFSFLEQLTLSSQRRIKTCPH